MSQPSERQEILSILREILGNPSLNLSDANTARDVRGWDSLAHVKLIVRIERKYDIRFGIDELSNLRDFGELVRFVQMKILDARAL